MRECPIQEDLFILKDGCPFLEEINLSGDSWFHILNIKLNFFYYHQIYFFKFYKINNFILINFKKGLDRLLY